MARWVQGTPAAVMREIEWPAHPRDAELLRDARHRIEHRRQQVRVLVGIEMRGPDAGGDDARAPAPPVRRRRGSAAAPPRGATLPRSRAAAARRPAPSGRPPAPGGTPISSEGTSRASRTASSNAAPFAIRVVAVRMPRRCASTMPSFTSGVKPKSSALTMRCLLKTGSA